MKNIDRAKTFTTHQEGIRLKPYKCTEGKNTVGIGHNMDASPLPAYMAEFLAKEGQISTLMASKLFDTDYAVAVVLAMRQWPDFENMSENRQIALVDFIFQLGPGTVKKFVHANLAINSGNWGTAAAMMFDSLWAKECPNRAKEVTTLIREG